MVNLENIFIKSPLNTLKSENLGQIYEKFPLKELLKNVTQYSNVKFSIDTTYKIDVSDTTKLTLQMAHDKSWFCQIRHEYVSSLMQGNVGKLHPSVCMHVIN
jgi:hypothetical protein